MRDSKLKSAFQKQRARILNESNKTILMPTAKTKVHLFSNRHVPHALANTTSSRNTTVDTTQDTHHKVTNQHKETRGPIRTAEQIAAEHTNR